MATTRKKATAAAEEAAEVKTTAAKTETAEVKAPVETAAATAAAPAKKAPAAKKATSTRTTAAKKTAAKAQPEEKAEAKAEVFIEYGGVQVSVDEIIANAKKIVGDDKDIKVYVQPDTSKAYISFGEETASMDVFFC